MIIALDQDGPIADLHTAWYRRYNKDYDDNLTLEKVTHWDLHKFVKPECGTKIYDYLSQPDLYEEVQPVEGAKEGIEFLRAQGNSIVFVTAGVQGNLDQKLAWLHRHDFIEPGRHMKGVIFAFDKDLIRAQMLIDDGPHNIQAFGGMGIVWDAPYNRTISRKHYRIKSWKDLPELWGKLYG